MKRSMLIALVSIIVVIVVVVSAVGAFLLVTQNGKVTIYVKDPPASDSWEHVNVTFSMVQIHAANASGTSGWINLTVKTQTLDLVNLVNISGLLASANVHPGKYTQIRLVVINVTGVKVGGEHVNFTVPSGELKTTHPFNVTGGSNTKLTLEIDLSRSIVQSDGQWKFTPVLGAVTEG